MQNHNNESFKDGSNEIAALSDTAARLFKWATTNTDGNTREIATHLNQYARQLQSACECLNPSAHESLACFSIIIEEGLELLIGEERALTINESSFLKKIPDILSEYILIPESKIPDAKFLRHLKNKYWIRPVSATEEKVLLELLVPSAITDESEQTPEPPPELIIEPDTDTNNSGPDIIVSESMDTDTESTLDLDSFSNDINSDSDSAGTPEDKEDTNEITLAQHSEAHLQAFSEKDDLHPDLKPDKQTSAPTITEQQQELITLICDELDEIIDDGIYNKIPDSIDIAELNIHLISIAELIEHISNAIDMIGLEGLGNSCRLISTNVHLLALEKTSLPAPQKSLIEKWPSLIRLYLKDISGATHSSGSAALNIIQYLADSLWPDPLIGDEKLKLQSLLTSPQLKEEEKHARQNIATAEDMSLKMPDDANNELLDALLLDLPAQTEGFSNALQNLHTQNNLEYLDVAQRIAHTLKGASNVVGVKGIANLTHHLEDILEIQSKAKKLPSTELHNVLSDAADCLETMSEALLGIDTPPDNSQEIFQSILDWANKLDIEGATQKTQPSKNRTQASPLLAFKTDTPDITPDQTTNPVPSAHSLESTLRVPVTLADELLRLTGENLISTSQVYAYIKTIKNRYSGLKTHNLSLQKLSFDLEHVIDIQGVLNNRQTTLDKKFDPLELDEFHELHAMSRQLVEIAADAIEITQLLEKDIDQLQGLVISQDKLQKESQNLVLRTRMVPTKNITARLKRGVKQTCRQTNKQVELEVQHNNTQMDSEVLHQMIEPRTVSSNWCSCCHCSRFFWNSCSR
ncbi:MAG TPA: hypothetical protein ENJ08_19525, partial [Gammaproteobacteria bacterium]|nr:hypothetical protein [Gammaproteobacteria bacterium]